MERIGDGLKKLLLAGIGAAALTGEKAQDLVDDLVKKGELTVEQGKVLNKELRRDVKEKVKDAAENAKASSKERAASLKSDRKAVMDTISDPEKRLWIQSVISQRISWIS